MDRHALKCSGDVVVRGTDWTIRGGAAGEEKTK